MVKITVTGCSKWTLIVLVIFVFLFCYGYPEKKVKEEYQLGVLLDKNNFKHEAALHVAIQQINKKRYPFEFRAIIKHINENDPFQAMKAACELLEEGIVGILGPLTEDNSNVVQSILDLKEVPHIEVRWDDYPLNGTVVNIHPFPDVLTRTYYDLIKRWGWEDFVILYENKESLLRVGELVKIFDPSEHTVVLKQLDTIKLQGEYRQVLKEIMRSGATHFLLDCSIDSLSTILQHAQQVGLMTDKFNFIITNLDMHTIDLLPYQFADTNITGMRFVDPDNEFLRQTAQAIHTHQPKNDEDDDLADTLVDEIYPDLLAGYKLKLEEALIFDAVQMFAEAINASRPLIKPTVIDCYNKDDKLYSGTSIVNIMKGLDYPGLTGIIKFDNMGFRGNFALDIVELMEGGQTVVGTWNSSQINHLNISRIFIDEEEEALDISNRTFIVMTTLTKPYGMMKESQVPLYGNDQYEGFAIDLIKELAVMKGFNYTFKIREDKANGEQLPNGSWTGMIGDICDGTVHLAITDLTITREREEAVDFTSPFMMTGIGILYQKPKKAPPSFFSFADPFAFEVWKLLMASWIGVAVILFILGRISPAEWENPYPCVEEPEYLVNQLDFRNCMWFVTGSIMQQGSEIELKSVATRMIAGMWFFFTLLMVSSYTANLAAFLTTEKADPHFTTLQELVSKAEEKGIKYGAKKGGATAKFFQEKAKMEPDSDFAKAWEQMQKYASEVLVLENDDGVGKAQKERYAFFMETSSIEYEIQRKCNLDQVGNKLDEKSYGIAMKKNSTFRHTLSNAILSLQQSGKIAEIKRKWWEERRGGGQCVKGATSDEATALNLKGVEGVFWVTMGGVIVALFLAMIETLIATGKKAIQLKTSYWSVLREEIKFYLKFKQMEKQIIYPEESEHSESQEKTIRNFDWSNKECSFETLASNDTNISKRSKSKVRRSKSRSRSRSRSRRSRTGRNNLVRQNSEYSC